MAPPVQPTIISAMSYGTYINIVVAAVTDADTIYVTLDGSDGTINQSFSATNTTLQISGFTSGVAHTVSVYTKNSGNENSTTATATVDDISVGLKLWIDVVDTSGMTFGGLRTIGPASYATVTQINDKSNNGANATVVGGFNAPILVPSVALGLANSSSILAYGPTNGVSYQVKENFLPPALLLRGDSNPGAPGGYDSLHSTIAQPTSGTPLSFFSVCKQLAAASLFGTADAANEFLNYDQYYCEVGIGGYDSFNPGIRNSTVNGGKGAQIANYNFVVEGMFNQEPSGGNPYMFGTRIYGYQLGSDPINNYYNFNDFRICGRQGYSPTSYFSECMLYNRILTTNEIYMLEGYLAWKYSLQAGLINSHPYYSTPFTGQVKTSNGSSSYTAVTGITTTSAINSFIQTGANSSINAYTLTYGDASSLYQFRSALHGNTYTLTQRGATKASVLSVIADGSPKTIAYTTTPAVTNFISTFDTTNTVHPPNPALPLYSVVPVYTGGSSPYTATVDLATDYNGKSYAQHITDGSATIVFEIPISVTGAVYELTLTYDGSSSTVKYNGSLLTDASGNTYNANSTLMVGAFPLPLVGLGSLGTNGNGGGGGVPCFPRGSPILTADGYKLVETLTKDDTVRTADGRDVPIKLYSFIIQNPDSDSAPYRIQAGALGHYYPPQDVCLSPRHTIQDSRGIWQIPKRLAIHNPLVQQYRIGLPVEYFHIECPDFFTDDLVVGGAIVESYKNRQGPSGVVYVWSKELNGFIRNKREQVGPVPKNPHTLMLTA